MKDKEARDLNEYMNQEVEYMKEEKQGGFLGLSEVVEFVENDKNLTDEQTPALPLSTLLPITAELRW